jgi:translocation and assembly module TamB
VVRYRAGAPLQVRGTVTVPEADIHLERLDMGVSASADVVVLDPVDPEAPLPRCRCSWTWTLAMGDAVKIDGYGMDGSRWAAACACSSSPAATCAPPARLEVDGRYRAYGQNLKITRGSCCGRIRSRRQPASDRARRARGRQRHRRHQGRR